MADKNWIINEQPSNNNVDKNFNVQQTYPVQKFNDKKFDANASTTEKSKFDRFITNDVAGSRNVIKNFVTGIPTMNVVEYTFDKIRDLGIDYTQLEKFVRKLIIDPNENINWRLRKPKSYLGTAIERFVILKEKKTSTLNVFSRARIDNNYLINDTVTEGEPTPELTLFLNIVWITITQEKVVNKTPLNGASGTIKELAYFDDPKITLMGQFVDNSKLFAPTNALEALDKIYQVRRPLYIVSDVLNSIGIFDVVMDSYYVSEHESHKNVFNFEIQLTGDQLKSIYYQ